MLGSKLATLSPGNMFLSQWKVELWVTSHKVGVKIKWANALKALDIGPTTQAHSNITTTTAAAAAAAAAKSLQSCLTLCGPIGGSLPGSAVPGILQARTLECVAISFSNAWKWKVKVKLLSHVRLLATPWTAAYQAPPSMGFSRQEYWSGVPLPSPNKVLVTDYSRGVE